AATAAPQPQARALVPAASRSVLPAPQRARSMTYRPLPARTGATAATTGVRSRAGTPRGVPPRAMGRRR
ncbi:MAG: hypothetical protein ACREMR_10885, partial [Gemmatimonadales bacterium]